MHADALPYICQYSLRQRRWVINIPKSYGFKAGFIHSGLKLNVFSTLLSSLHFWMKLLGVTLGGAVFHLQINPPCCCFLSSSSSNERYASCETQLFRDVMMKDFCFHVRERQEQSFPRRMSTWREDDKADVWVIDWFGSLFMPVTFLILSSFFLYLPARDIYTVVKNFNASC